MINAIFSFDDWFRIHFHECPVLCIFIAAGYQRWDHVLPHLRDHKLNPNARGPNGWTLLDHANLQLNTIQINLKLSQRTQENAVSYYTMQKDLRNLNYILDIIAELIDSGTKTSAELDAKQQSQRSQQYAAKAFANPVIHPQPSPFGFSPIVTSKIQSNFKTGSTTSFFDQEKKDLPSHLASSTPTQQKDFDETYLTASEYEQLEKTLLKDFLEPVPVTGLPRQYPALPPGLNPLIPKGQKQLTHAYPLSLQKREPSASTVIPSNSQKITVKCG